MQARYRIILMIVCLIIFSIYVHAEISQKEYKGIIVKYYDDKKQDSCIKILDLVPQKYLNGLKYIKVLPQKKSSFGHYHENYVLEIYGECDMLEIMHELAHHRQKMMGDSSYNMTHHLGNFQEFEHEIFLAMQANQEEKSDIREITGMAIRGKIQKREESNPQSIRTHTRNLDSSLMLTILAIILFIIIVIILLNRK